MVNVDATLNGADSGHGDLPLLPTNIELYCNPPRCAVRMQQHAAHPRRCAGLPISIPTRCANRMQKNALPPNRWAYICLQPCDDL